MNGFTLSCFPCVLAHPFICFPSEHVNFLFLFCFHILHRITLEIMTLQPKCEDVETAEGVAITVTGVAQVNHHTCSGNASSDSTHLLHPLHLHPSPFPFTHNRSRGEYFTQRAQTNTHAGLYLTNVGSDCCLHVFPSELITTSEFNGSHQALSLQL